MIYKPKGRRRYKVKFRFNGQLIHRSTTATTHKAAKGIEAKIRAELAEGNWGILKRKPSPTLREFLTEAFLPFIESKFKSERKTLDYYFYGTRSLLKSGLASLKLDEITDQHAGQYAAKKGHLSPSTINCGLRTLRRALALAAEWGTLERRPKLRLAKGERRRERVLSGEEIAAYVDACLQPWRDAAIIMLGSGARPGEVFSLRWENVFFNADGGSIQVIEGKSKTARRTLPMIPVVFEALRARHEKQGCPSEGWVFPTKSRSGYLTQGTAKKQHAIALKKSEVRPFEPYCLRHTALTNMGSLGVDAFTLARIAGHSSITMTERYCHPQKDAIERAFTTLGQSQKVVTEGGHHQNLSTDEKE